MGRIEVHKPGVCSQRPRLLAPALWLLALSPLIADDPPVRSVRDTVVDQMLLQDGTRLKGMAVSRKPPQLLVRTGWLKQHAPDFLERSVRPVARTSLQANAQRLKVLLTEAAAKQPAGEQKSDPPGNLARTTLLQEVLQRLEPDEDLLPTHVVVESLRSTFRTADLRTDAQRMLGLRAMAADITDFEQLHWKAVAARLQQSAAAAPGPAEPAADMTEAQLQQVAWCILAAIDVRTNEALKLVRSGTAFIDEDSRPDPAQLLQVAANQSTRGLLQDLLDEASGQPVRLNAGKESVHGVLETLPPAAADMHCRGIRMHNGPDFRRGCRSAFPVVPGRGRKMAPHCGSHGYSDRRRKSGERSRSTAERSSGTADRRTVSRPRTAAATADRTGHGSCRAAGAAERCHAI